LVDGGYPAHDQLDAAAAHTVVDAPVPKAKDPTTGRARRQGRR
jgi:hypothetical protein